MKNNNFTITTLSAPPPQICGFPQNTESRIPTAYYRHQSAQ